MRIRLCHFLGPSLLIAFAQSLQAAPQESVKFTPTLKLYECPPNFTYRSDCKANEKKLEPQKLILNLEVLDQRMGQWSLQMSEPVPVSFYVIVVRGRIGKNYQYSVSTEAGLAGSAAPFANGRVEFNDNSTPSSFGISSSPVEKDGKKFLAEIRLSDFHGKPIPNRK